MKRARKVARKLDLKRDSRESLDELSARLVDRKLDMGHERIERLLRRDLAVSGLVARLGPAISRGSRKFSTIELSSVRGEAEAVPDWYAKTIASNDERPLLAACPDHYLSRTNADGSQEIIETTGGSPFAVRMFFDDADTESIRTPIDRSFPTQWVSVAKNAEGNPIGGVRHQFRDEPGGGFTVRLTVEFPVTTAPHMIAAHRWHLACEFSNWIEHVNTQTPASREASPSDG